MKGVARLDAQIAKLEERINAGDVAPAARPTPFTSPMIESRIAQRKALQAELEALRDEAGIERLVIERWACNVSTSVANVSCG